MRIRGLLPAAARLALAVLAFVAAADAHAASCTVDADCGPSVVPCYRRRCATGLCVYERVPGCCTGNADCDDANPCTTDDCLSYQCNHLRIAGCCVDAGDCPAGAPCTRAICAGNTCQSEPVPGCCTDDTACDDDELCTADRCDGGTCAHDTIAGCCRTVADCDANRCMTVSCAENRCAQAPIAEAACADTDPCTIDGCVPPDGCVHHLVDWQTVRGSLAAAVTDPACTNGPLPKTLRALLRRAGGHIRRAGVAVKLRKRAGLLDRADASLRRASRACAKARSRKKGAISSGCHDALTARIARDRQWITCLRGSSTEPPPACGNGRVDRGEPCDGDAGSCPKGQRCTTACTCEAEPPPSLAGLAVGAWSGGATCDGTGIRFVFFLCPQGRLRGAETIAGHDFLDCGTWRVDGDRLVLEYRYTSVEDPGVTDTQTLRFDYRDGQLVWVSGCPFPLERAAGAVDAALCTTGACTGGGTGDIDCGTDCDCGRCWYCEQGTCRYGGEGPYGCYRGCPWDD